MRLELFCKPNQVFKLANGKAAKFFLTNSEAPHPFELLSHEGVIYRYDSRGRYQGTQEHKLNVVEAMPDASWEVALGRCHLGQVVLMRDYSLGFLEDVQPGTLGATYTINSGGTKTQHNHNGWVLAGSSENDVVAYFHSTAGAPFASREQMNNVQQLVNRLRTSLYKKDKQERKLELVRVKAGIARFINVMEELDA